MHAQLATVICDANVVVKWFRDGEDEEEAQESLMLRDAHRDRRILVEILDLTLYEVANALMLGRAGAGASQVETVLKALDVSVRSAPSDPTVLGRAARLVERHRGASLTFYDAAYAAAAKERDARLATLDAKLLDLGLGERPSSIVAGLGLQRGEEDRDENGIQDTTAGASATDLPS